MNPVIVVFALVVLVFIVGIVAFVRSAIKGAKLPPELACLTPLMVRFAGQRVIDWEIVRTPSGEPDLYVLELMPPTATKRMVVVVKRRARAVQDLMIANTPEGPSAFVRTYRTGFLGFTRGLVLLEGPQQERANANTRVALAVTPQVDDAEFEAVLRCSAHLETSYVLFVTAEEVAVWGPLLQRERVIDEARRAFECLAVPGGGGRSS